MSRDLDGNRCRSQRLQCPQRVHLHQRRVSSDSVARLERCKAELTEQVALVPMDVIWRPAHGPRGKNGHHRGDEHDIEDTIGSLGRTLRLPEWHRLQKGLHSGRSRRVPHYGPVGVVDRQARIRALPVPDLRRWSVCCLSKHSWQL